MNRQRFSVERMCRALKVSRSGYYDWVDRKPSERTTETVQMRTMVKAEYLKSKGRYGSPKIAKALRARGVQVSRPRVARLMSSEGIKSIIRRKYRVSTTQSDHDEPVSANHLSREFTAAAPGAAWVSDITYVRTCQGWLYLTVILDLFDRKVVGWSLSSDLSCRHTVMAAWRMAIGNRPLSGKLLFHSDRGVQYACQEFRGEIKDRPVTQSMSRKGNCWDNAVAESFFKILKSEMVYHHSFKDHAHAKREIFEFIEIWYNRHRLHSHLGYVTPEEFGKRYLLDVA